jgi:hypothetical protein
MKVQQWLRMEESWINKGETLTGTHTNSWQHPGSTNGEYTMLFGHQIRKKLETKLENT